MIILKEIWEHKIRFIKTCVLCMSFAALGVTSNMSGPCLLDLRQAVQATQAEINYLFFVSSGGYVVGSLILGVLNEKIHPQIGFGVAILFMGACSISLPWNRTLYGLLFVAFIMQIAGGIIDCIGNVWVFRLWGKYSGPFNQALHMSWGIGAFISPLIAAPFLSENTNRNETEAGSSEDDIDNISLGQADDVRITWAYGIASAISLCCATLVFLMFFIKRSDIPHPSKIEGDKARIKQSAWQKAKILIIIALLLHFYCSNEITIGRLLTSFSVFSDLKLSKIRGAYITSIYWGTFTFSRFFIIFIIAFTGPKWMLWIDFTILIIANAILIPFGQVYEIALWIGAALLGLGNASIFPTLFAITEELLSVTPRISSMFLVVGVSGEMILPVISGLYIETFPMLFIYLTTLGSVMCFILFAILCFVTKDNKKINE